MNLEITATLLQSGEAAQRSAAARELGRTLAARSSGGWLVQFRKLAARLLRAPSSDYERGFLEALELVATGFERQVSEIRADESELARIRTRAHWSPALHMLSRGALRPVELSARLGISKSQVSKLIDELEDAELVTQVADGKERPCMITSRARVLLEKLPADAERLEPEKLVPAVVQCVGMIARDGRVGRGRLLAMMQRGLTDAAPHVLELLGKSLRESSFGFHDDDDALVAPELELQTRIATHLALACSGKHSSLIRRLEELTAESPVLLRIADGMNEWDVLAAQRLKGLQVIRRHDLELLPPSPDKRFQMVYGSPSLVVEDLKEGRKALVQKASGRYYLGVDFMPPIKDFLPIDVQRPEITA
jgi:DNA-binding transcriptional ArsR family regulator